LHSHFSLGKIKIANQDYLTSINNSDLYQIDL